MLETIRYRPWAEPGAAAVTFLPKMTEHPEARRRELDHAEVATVVIVGVEPPPEPPIELLRAVGIRDGDDDHLELRVDSCDAGRVVLRNSSVLMAASSVVWDEVVSRHLLLIKWVLAPRNVLRRYLNSILRSAHRHRTILTFGVVTSTSLCQGTSS